MILELEKSKNKNHKIDLDFITKNIISDFFAYIKKC